MLLFVSYNDHKKKYVHIMRSDRTSSGYKINNVLIIEHFVTT